MAEYAIETRALSVYYGTHRGVLDVDLTVERGEVFGFLGPNGAGKTTTQRVLIDVIRPTRGTACVFGLDCSRHGKAIRKRVGYLPGELSLSPTLTADRFLSLMASLESGRVPDAYRQELCERLELDSTRRIGSYSRGNKQKIGVVAAFMTKPDLVILDEPTTGLDPLVQQTVMELIRETKADGRTVFLSSHVLAEVQAVCDRVGIIRDGRLVKTESVETLTHQRFRRLRLRLGEAPTGDAFELPGTTEISRDGNLVTLEVRGDMDVPIKRALSYQLLDIETLPVTLEEVFLEYYGRGANGGTHE